MVFILTNATLTTTLQSYFKRSDADFVSNIPAFTMFGERRVARDLKILGSKTFIDGFLTPGNQRLQKDVRWLNNASFNIGVINPDFGTTLTTRVEVLECAYNFGQIYWPNPQMVGQPKYYADLDTNLWGLYPTPDIAYPYRVGYYQFPTFIDSTDQRNWFTDNAPEVLFAAVALEAAIYLEDEQNKAVWEKKYQDAVGALTAEDKQRIYDDYSVR